MILGLILVVYNINASEKINHPIIIRTIVLNNTDIYYGFVIESNLIGNRNFIW
jgi:hypothetical protein